MADTGFMKKALYFDWFGGATEFYRLAPLDYIKDFVIERSTERDIKWATLLGYSAVILTRPSSGQSLSLIKLAKDMGIKVIADFDDDCIHIDEYNPMYENYVNEKKNVLECVALCDEVWVSTNAIKTAFKLFNRNIHVIPNAHNDYLFPVKDKKTFTYNKIAMWRGGYSHEGDMYDGETPERVIEMVNANQDWTFNFLGQRFTYLEKRCGKNYISVGGASTVQFYRMMHKFNPCVFFYPLATNIFNRSKSNCSWLEATYSGAAFFGNKNLPEFDKISVCDFNGNILKADAESLRIANSLSWDYICDDLLLSKVNEKRIERLKYTLA